MPNNPFVIKKAKKMFTDLGIEVGDYIRVSWNYDTAYGDGTAYHEGRLSELDDWIKVEDSPRSPGYLRLPLTAVATVEAIEVEKIEPTKIADGIQVGDMIRVTFDEGGKEMVHEGKLLKFDGTYTIGGSKATPVQRQMLSRLVKTIEKIEVESDPPQPKKPNPFVAKSKAKPNPFIKRRIPGKS